MALTPGEFAGATGVSRETLEKLSIFADHLRKWQGAVNLVGRDTLVDLWRRHMLDSAQLVPCLPEGAGPILDLGSGAGFPGLVMAIMTGRKVDMVESSGKKAAFLAEAIRLTGANATIRPARIEKLTPAPYDVVTARALAPLDMLLGYAFPFRRRAPGRGTVFLFPKGARVEDELTDAAKSWKMTVERIPSVTDPAGAVLRIRDLSRA